MAKQEKLEQVLTINPQHELKFVGPFTSAVTSYITLTNPSEKNVCFKIKTTAPKQYCVRPNSGTLKTRESVQIAVSLQPQAVDFPGHENYKHKFMVQTMFAPEGEFDSDLLWRDMKPENLMDSKLKCVFESASETKDAVAQEVEVTAQEAKVTKATKVSSVKASPKAGSMTAEGELKRAAAEVKSLREEESSLRQENLMLKEEVLRLRRSAAMVGDNREGSDSAVGSSVQSLAPHEISPGLYVAFALIAILVGIVLGKFML